MAAVHPAILSFVSCRHFIGFSAVWTGAESEPCTSQVVYVDSRQHRGQRVFSKNEGGMLLSFPVELDLEIYVYPYGSYV